MNNERGNNLVICPPERDYLYKTALPHAFITALEWSGVLEKGAWGRATKGSAEETKLLDYFAATLDWSYGIPFAYSTEEIFTAVEVPLTKAKKRWMRKRKWAELLDL